jgi:hypothetical protein
MHQPEKSAMSQFEFLGALEQAMKHLAGYLSLFLIQRIIGFTNTISVL